MYNGKTGLNSKENKKPKTSGMVSHCNHTGENVPQFIIIIIVVTTLHYITL